MKVECNDKQTFRLTDNEQSLGALTYKSFFSYKAEITFGDSDRYDIKPVGFFGTSIAVTKNEAVVANLLMNWKGQIVVSFIEGQEFVFLAKGVFQNKYIIENKDGEKLIQLDPKFNWSKYNYNYDIEYDKKPQDILLVLLGVYAANYFIATMSGATSGLA